MLVHTFDELFLFINLGPISLILGIHNAFFKILRYLMN